MATKKITFDPEAGVAYPCDLIMNVGADFSATFNVVDTSNTGFNFSTTNSVGLNTVSGWTCILYTSQSPRDRHRSRMPSSS